MKIRIREQTVRFRLTQEEVERLRDGGQVESTLTFGPIPSQQLGWRLDVDTGDGTTSQLHYDSGQTTLRIARPIAEPWLSDDTAEGFTEEVTMPSGNVVTLTVQRDYACLVPRDPAEDAGAFPHPEGSHSEGGCC